MNPRVSIVVPCFNHARFIEECLVSILSQEYPALELLVLDGGSTDGSVDIIRRYEKHITFWKSGPDGGQTAALIDGFTRSTGEIQAWLNSDDCFAGRPIWEAADYFAAHPDVDVVYGDTLCIDEAGRPVKEQREIGFYKFLWLHTYNYVPSMSAFWRRSIYEKVGGLDPAFSLAMDADLWIRMSEVGRLAHIRRQWSRWRVYPEQKTQRLAERRRREEEMISSRYLARDTPVLRLLRRGAARSARVALKAATGCYPVREWLPRLAGRI